MKSRDSIQDMFLNIARKNKIELQVFLVNGKPLTGRIKSFDNFTFILSNQTQQFLIYKHAVSTIIPKVKISFQNAADDTAEESK